MRHTLLVAAREMREQSFLLIAAAVLALIPIATVFIPMASRLGRLEMVAALGFGVAATFAFVVAMMIGATMVGRELSDRRLSFYFSRPLPAVSIWFGKLTAGLLMTVISYMIIALPAALVASGQWRRTWEVTPVASIGLTAAIGLLVLLVAHSGSTAVRSRSPLVFADLLGLGIAVVAVWLIIRPLAEAIALGVIGVYLIVIAIAAALMLIAAGAWQIAHGRVDAQRSHRELSKFVWIATAVILMALAAFTLWFVNVGPEDLRNASAQQATRGPWAVLSGKYEKRGDYEPVLLYDTSSGRSVRLSRTPWMVSSLDGRSVVWSRQSGFSPDKREIAITSLGENPVTRSTGITIPILAPFVMSDDGRQVAVADGTNVSVYDLDTRRLLGSARIRLQQGRLLFTGPGRVRMLSRWPVGAPASAGKEGVNIIEFDTASKTVSQTGALELAEGRVMFAANSDGSRLLVNHWIPRGADQSSFREVLVVDGRTAAVVANLGQPGRGFAATFLSDGRIVSAGSTNGRVTIQIYSPQGAHLRDVDSGAGDAAYGPVEIAPNRIALWQNTIAKDLSQTPNLVVVDLDKGAVRRMANVWPSASYTSAAYWGPDPRLITPEPNRALLVADKNHSLWKLDPVSGQKTRVTGGK